MRPTEAHSRTGDGRQRDLSGPRINKTNRGPLTNWRRQTEDLSGHPNNPTDRGPLTVWRRQTERLVRTSKQPNRPRPTHELETADRATSQDTETIRPTEAHSHSGDGRQSDLSEHRNNPTDRGPLTSWRRQTERLVRTSKQSDRPRPTHSLETADRVTCQDTK